MKKILEHPVAFILIRFWVGGIFLVFGTTKAIEPLSIFTRAIRDYQMLPEMLVPIFAVVMIALEIVFGLLFLTGLFTRQAAWGIVGLLIMFLIALGQAMVRGLELSDCGCSGSMIKLGETPQDVFLRDAMMLVGMVWFLGRPKIASRLTLDKFFSKKF